MSEDESNALASRIAVTNVDGHALSMRNQLLIALQLGCHCTIVGGFRQWLKQGRCVRKGQHGATILFPRTFGERNGVHNATQSAETAATAETEKKSNVRFLSGTVFDVTQTEVISKEEANETAESMPNGTLFVPPPFADPPPPNVVQAVHQFAEPITAHALTIWNSDGVDAPALICAPPPADAPPEKLANARTVTAAEPEQFKLL